MNLGGSSLAFEVKIVRAWIRQVPGTLTVAFCNPNAASDAGLPSFSALRPRDELGTEQYGDADGPRCHILRHGHSARVRAEHSAGPPRGERKPSQGIRAIVLMSNLQRCSSISVRRIIHPPLGRDKTCRIDWRRITEKYFRAFACPPYGFSPRQQMGAKGHRLLELVLN